MTSRLVLAWVLLGATGPSLQAQIAVAEWEGGGLDLAGYVRALSAVQSSAFDLPGSASTTAFAGQVARLNWTARGGDRSWVIEVHDRLQAVVTSESGLAGSSVVGFGVSAVPGRTIDLETDLVDEERVRVWHDLDRLALTFYTAGADVTVGRQAITWGLSNLFPVADLWARFSPFELDTEEKPGIDAVRALFYPADALELDAVLADRGSLDDLSAGIRATWTGASGDLYLGAGKFWREAILLAGGTYLLDELKLRAEAALPWEIDDENGDGEEGPARPRVTVGADWITAEWVVSGEAHFNGVGEGDPSDYSVLVATDPRLARGESYYLGQILLGAVVSHRVTDRLSVSTTGLVNVEDPSVALTPAAVYDLGQNARISVGGLGSFGEEPVSGGPSGIPLLRSEFGSYGSLAWTRVSLYF